MRRAICAVAIGAVALGLTACGHQTTTVKCADGSSIVFDTSGDYGTTEVTDNQIVHYCENHGTTAVEKDLP